MWCILRETKSLEWRLVQRDSKGVCSGSTLPPGGAWLEPDGTWKSSGLAYQHNRATRTDGNGRELGNDI